MSTFLVRRVLQGVLVVVVVAAVVFFIMRLVPGDPARLMNPRASGATLKALEVQMGLDKPAIVQLGVFIKNMMTGDMGKSYFQQESVTSLIFAALPRTVLIAVLAMAMGLVAGIPLGFVAALYRDRLIDRVVLGIQIVFQSAPNFWLALVLIIVVAVDLHLVAPEGYTGVESAVLPAVSLAVSLIAVISLVARETMVDVLRSVWIVGLESRGVRRRAIIWRHATKHTLVPLLTLAGAQVGYLLGGAVVVEWIFNYPGLGLLTINAVLEKDYPLVQGIVIVVATIFVGINLLVDILYGLIDPRVRL